MKPLWPLYKQLALSKGLDRSDNPAAWGGFYKTTDITLDGKLNEDVWQRSYHLRQIVTGDKPTDGVTTAVSAAWDDQASTLYLSIVCRDPDMKHLNIGSTRNGDTGIFLGDLIELHLETQNHVYYQLAVNPAGELVDIDRHDGGRDWEWSSGAEAAGHITDDYWSVEVRIPVIAAVERDLDPNRNGIAGFRPTRQSPWYINVCRQRIRGDTADLYALSPTGKAKFHDRSKLGMFYVGGKRPGIIRALERREQRARELERAEHGKP
jgi:hypothetical protein